VLYIYTEVVKQLIIHVKYGVENLRIQDLWDHICWLFKQYRANIGLAGLQIYSWTPCTSSSIHREIQ